MTVCRLTSDLENEYTQFLLKQEKSLFYASLKYRDFLKSYLECEDEYYCYLGSNGIEGVLPILKRSSPFGDILNSLPFYGSNGGIISSNSFAYEALINFYNQRIFSPEVAVSCLIDSPFSENLKIEQTSTFKDQRIGQITLIPNFDEQFETNLFNLIDSSTRRNIKKAQTENVKVSIDNSLAGLKCLFDIHFDNISAIGGKAKEWKFFELIPKFFNPIEDYNVFIARKDDQIIAALLVFYFNKTVEYFTPGTVHEFRNIQPMGEILRHALQDASQRGFLFWNWGGTWFSQEGVYKFKKKWGAKDFPYTYHIQLNNSDLLNCQPIDLVNTSRGFYTVPFSALKGIT